MRHLKTYRLFEGYDAEVYQTIMDICQELKDDGFNINVEDDQKHVPRMNISELHIDKLGEYFSIFEVDEIMDRLTQYLGDMLRGIYYKGSAGSSWVGIDSKGFLKYLLESNQSMYCLKIEFRTK